MILFVYLSEKQVIPLSETGQGKKSAIFIPVGPDLTGQGNNAMILSFVFHNTCQGSFHIRILNQQAHAAAELTLNSAGRRSDPVFHIVLQEQIPKAQALFVIGKKDVPPKVGIIH